MFDLTVQQAHVRQSAMSRLLKALEADMENWPILGGGRARIMSKPVKFTRPGLVGMLATKLVRPAIGVKGFVRPALAGTRIRKGV